MRTRSLLCAVALFAASGCADNNASIQLAAICSAPDDAAACSFSSTCDQQYIGDVAIDLDDTSSLQLIVQVNNQLPDNASAGAKRVNTNDAFVRATVTRFEGVSLPETFEQVPGSAWVQAGGSSVISIEPIDVSAAAALRAMIPAGNRLITAYVKLLGVYSDTTEFETGEFAIPIYACRGCVPAAAACTTAGAQLKYCPQAGQFPSSSACVGGSAPAPAPAP